MRKYTGAPYITHPLRVALAIAFDSGIKPHDYVWCAAILHDVLEDTNTTPEQVSEACGDGVLKLVQELTNPSHLPEHKDKKRWERKKIDRDHLANVSGWAKEIKKYDRLDNLLDMDGASEDFKRLYVGETLDLLDVLEPEKESPVAQRILLRCDELEKQANEQ